MNAVEVKALAKKEGVELCGVAPVERFAEAPKGYHPRDVLPSCQSVIALAKRFPSGPLQCSTTTPYTLIRNYLSDELDRIAARLCTALEDSGITAVPTGTVGPVEFDGETGRYRAIVSAKHAAALAGLGRIGRNSLLVTPEYGNMIWLSVLLTDAALEGDPLLPGSPCPEGCRICMDVCPVHALDDGPLLQQMVCNNYAFAGQEGEGFRIRCHKCRTVCPNCLRDTTL